MDYDYSSKKYSMKVDDELILKLETLSKLKLQVDERKAISKDLEKIIAMFDEIASVDTTGVSPLIHLARANQPLRKDEVINNDSESVLKVFTHTKERYITVPKVIDKA